MHDELHRQIAELVGDRADQVTPPPVGVIRRRGRRRRARLAGAATGVVLALVAGTVGVERLTSRPASPQPVPATTIPPVARPVVTGSVARVPAGGFEVPVPAGWTARTVPGLDTPEIPNLVELVPPRSLARGTTIVLQTQILWPDQHPGLPPGEDPGGEADRYGIGFFTLDDRGSPLGHGQRPDGRPYVWRTRKLPDEVGEYAIAWPFHCAKGGVCPPGHRWRVLVMQAGRSQDPAVRRKLLKVDQQVIDTVRPITNALPGGDPAQPDPALPRRYPGAGFVPAPATTGPKP
jgi:hypothetical protein